MRSIIKALLLCAAILSINCGRLSAELDDDWLDILGSNSAVELSLAAEQSSVRAGDPFWVALHFKCEEPWHCYWQNPGDAGLGPKIQWHLPADYEVLEVVWPTPNRYESAGQVTFGYDRPFTLLARIQPSASVKPGDKALIALDAQWVSCSNENCLPGMAKPSIEIPVASNTPIVNSQSKDLFAEARSQLPQKIEPLKGFQQHDLIVLTVPLTVDERTSIDFYPSQTDIINHHAHPRILSTQKGVTIALDRCPQSQASKDLQGVLVVNANEGRQAFSLNILLQNDSSEELTAMLEAQKINAKTFAAPSVAAPEYEGGVLLAIVMAFIGGMILNLMPCVLPVISFKVLSFVQMSGQSRATIFRHGLVFSAGVLVSFWVLASVLLILQAYGNAVGWGFQLQEPIFVGILAAVLLVFGLSMFGVFEFGAFFAAWVGTNAAQGPQKESYIGSFVSGILATAVATPCTGPFLGSAVGYAVTLPAIQALLIFTSLGLGMAFPYLLLSANPSLLKFVPKPGAWMESFKQFMGFVMIASVLWLVWVFGFQTSTMSQSLLLIGLFLISLGCWIYGRWGAPHRSRRTRMLSLVLCLLLLGWGGQSIISAARTSTDIVQSTVETPGWENFDPARLEALQAQGVPVFVDFTAKWCLICQANHLVLMTNNVEREMLEHGVVRMKADWTKSDPAITAYLKKYGRNSVPLYLLFDGNKDAQPQILPQVLTQDVLVDAVNRINSPIVEAR